MNLDFRNEHVVFIINVKYNCFSFLCQYYVIFLKLLPTQIGLLGMPVAK